MSKLGKKSIEIPAGVTVTVTDNMINVTGPLGTLTCNYYNRVRITIADNLITVLPLETAKTTQYQGLYNTLIQNLMTGVKDGVTKKLEFNGIGYKAAVENGDLVLNMGYSHPVRMAKTPDVTFSVSENTITVSGIDKVKVGDMAAKVRAVRPPEPYKGKGIKYADEVIIRKESKSA